MIRDLIQLKSIHGDRFYVCKHDFKFAVINEIESIIRIGSIEIRAGYSVQEITEIFDNFKDQFILLNGCDHKEYLILLRNTITSFFEERNNTGPHLSYIGTDVPDMRNSSLSVGMRSIDPLDLIFSKLCTH